jgi:hypothetical protein
LVTPTSAKPWACAIAIARSVAWCMASMPEWLPPSIRAETGVAWMSRMVVVGRWRFGLAAICKILGSPEYS